LSISEELKNAMEQWAFEYGKWINWDKDQLLPNGITLEDNHNRHGLKLTEKLKHELSGEYRVFFSPSSMARMYAN
jgi:predicted hydrocarbon binding protein